MGRQHRERVKTQWRDSEPGAVSEHAGKAVLKILVYGTLKSGCANHARFCSGFLSLEPATVPGVLEWLTPQIPILHVAESLILARGTSDPLADLATQAHWAAQFEAEGQPYQDGTNDPANRAVGVVEGEVLGFDDPATRLPEIDRLEGFRPGSASLYSRVLIPVRLADSWVIPAWAYVASD